ncbi:MAG: DUF4097 family beta strand repeat-containing protein [Trebonia sp.]
MPHWTVDAPANLDFDQVTQLNVRLIGGTVAVLATDEKPSLTVAEVSGRPLQVDYSGGVVTIGYEKLTWEHLLDFLKPHKDRASVTVTVPADCPVQLGVVSASALVSGLTAGVSVKGVSGDITLDGVSGGVEANTVSGELQARSIDGPVRFESVSGELTLADSSISALTAQNVSGRVIADVTLVTPGAVGVTTVSGEVTLRLPGNTDARVRLNSVSGKIQTDFGSLPVKNIPASRTASGNVGAGTGHVSVTSVSGPITLLRRPEERCEPSHTEPPRAQAGMESETR